MRSSQKSNRSRGKSNRKNVGNNVNRVYESAGPDGKVRGTPQQIIDKYSALARDAQTSGDRVAAENFLQHAEHYYRLLSAALAAQAERRDQANGGHQPQQVESDGGQTDDGYSTQSASESSEGVNGMATFDGAEKPQLVETPEGGQSKRPSRRRTPRASSSGGADAKAGAEAPVKSRPVEETADEASDTSA